MGVENIKKVCALGTGIMGAGTALNFALAGYDVAMHARSEESKVKGQKDIDEAVRLLLKYELITEHQAAQALANINVTTDLVAAAGDADFVMESLKEDMGIKQETFALLDTICPPHTIFATNTSALSPTEISSATTRADKFIVCHMWNPPHLIPLVEVVKGEKTSQETAETAYDLMAAINMEPVHVAKEHPGFIGNYMQYALLAAGMHLVELGVATIEDIDKVIRFGIGRRLGITGPIESAELGGLPTFESISRTVGPHLPIHDGVPKMLADAVASGHHGALTGHGFRPWDPEDVAALKEARMANLARYRHMDHVRAAALSPDRPPANRAPHLVADQTEEAPAPGARTKTS